MRGSTGNSIAPKVLAPSSLAPNRRRGQAGLFVVLVLSLLFGVLSLTVDLGWGYYKRHAAQSAADAAALSAAVWATQNGMTCGVGGVVCGTVTSCGYPNVTPPTNPLQVACLYAQANGFVNAGSQTVSAQVNDSTTDPPGTSGNKPPFWVQVNVSESPHTLFGSFAHMSAFRVNAQATAGIATTPATSTIVILSATAAPALSVSGGAALSVSGGGVYVNSSDSTDALDVGGSGSLTAATINVHGQAYVHGGGTTSPSPPTTGAAVTPNPLAGISMPSFSGCDHTNYNAANGDVLTAGVYCGGITVGGIAQITVKPGKYILNGGGLSLGNSGKITSVAAADGTTGVTFFNTGDGSHPTGPLYLYGSGVMTVTAPTSGTYRGLVWYEDPSPSVTFSGQDSIGNSAVANLTGTVYFPQLPFVTSGAVTISTNMSVVALTWALTGSASLTNDTTGKSALTTISTSLIN